MGRLRARQESFERTDSVSGESSIEAFQKVAEIIRERDNLLSDNTLLLAENKLLHDVVDQAEKTQTSANAVISALTEKLKHLEGELADARGIVLRLYYSKHYREEWEVGETEDEAESHAVDRLANWGIDPGQPGDADRIRAVLKSAEAENVRPRGI